MIQKRQVFLVATIVIALASAAAIPATAALNADPAVSADSDIDNGATVPITYYDDANTTTLEVTTDNSDTIESATAVIEVSNRDLTVFEAGDQDGEYSVQTDADTDSDGTEDSDVHTWTINNSEFRDAPVEAGGTVDLDFEVTVTDDAGDSENVTGTFTLDNGMQRAAYVLDQAALDGDDAATLSASSETEESRLSSIPYIGGNDSTTYSVEATDVPTDGANTTHYIYVADSDAADEFESAADAGVLSNSLNPFADPEAESGDRIYDLSVAHDGHAASTFFEEVDADLFEDENGTTATYDASSDAFVIELGDDYSNESTVDLEASNQQPLDIVDSMDQIPSAMTQDLGFWDARSVFGATNAFSVTDWPLIGLLPLVVPVKRRREQAAA